MLRIASKHAIRGRRRGGGRSDGEPRQDGDARAPSGRGGASGRDLAREAGVALSTASGHLADLVEAGFVRVQRIGRQRRYRLSGPEVAQAIEALAAVAPRRPVTSLRAATAGERLRAGRTCYDHLAGRLGVAVSDALLERRALRLRPEGVSLTHAGQQLLDGLGVDVAGARRRKRGFALACQDLTERRFHLAGALGAALCERLFELGWVRRSGSGRAVTLTRAGAAGLRSSLDVELPVV